MRTTSGKASQAPFRIFFALITWAALCAQVALAQPAPKPGPMQSGMHATEAAAAQAPAFDVPKLFATTCGWCHFGGGREPGKGPQLMGTQLTDQEIVSRIRNGKVGAMPSFKGAFTDEQLQAIVAYIRGLKPLAAGEEKK